MTTIVGVDFSGAATDLNTWFAQGRLDDGNLVLDRVQPIRREDLYNLMLGLTAPAVAAMDFPFGLPEEFLPHIGVTDDYQTIDEIWTILADIDRQYLEDVAAEFVRDYAEPHRVVERHYPESSSTLHRVNPDMLPMTYLGCRLLSRWWDHENRPPWHVLPLEQPAEPPEKCVTVMETMPGAFLRSVRLPYRNYKGQAPISLQNRDRIIDGLGPNSGIALPNLDEWRYACRANTDCLDAIVAAVCAAAWRNRAVVFRSPEQLEEAAARREGWLYAPMRQ